MKTKTFVLRILIGLALVAVGILTMVQNRGFMRILILVCGVYITCGSLFGFFAASSFAPFLETSRLFARMSLVSNLAGLVLGLFAVIAPFAWARVVGAALFWAAAVYLLFAGFVSLRIYFGLRKAKAAYVPRSLAVEGLCDSLLALLLVFAPCQVAKTVLAVLGAVLIAAGAAVIVLAAAGKIRSDRRAAEGDGFERFD